jgi:hypothetical protein
MMNLQKLIIHLENEVKKYQEREERLMQQIDRMQTLIELKTVAPATAAPQQDATACDTDMPQHATTQQDNDYKKNNELNIVENVAVPQQETTAYHTKRYSMPHYKMWQCHKNEAYLAGTECIIQ